MYLILIYLIFAEIAVLFITIIYIAILRLISPHLKKKNLKIQKELSSIIITHLTQLRESPHSFLSPLFASPRNLLLVMESFEKRFNDDAWKAVKKEICRLYLLPRARKWARSWFWKKRFFAARTFALSPQKKDANRIGPLIEDRLFLVNSLAIHAAISLETKELLLAVLHKMHLTTGYPYYYCRDLLIQSSSKLFNWIEELASETKDVAFRLTLVDLLSTKIFPLVHLDLTEDLNAKDDKRRLNSVRLFSRSPQPNSRDVLLKALDDNNDEIRAEASKGLNYFPEEVCFKKLNHTLKDKIWAVRLQAGITLKAMGEKGRTILEKQDPTNHPEAYDAAQYVLRFY